MSDDTPPLYEVTFVAEITTTVPATGGDMDNLFDAALEQVMRADEIDAISDAAWKEITLADHP